MAVKGAFKSLIRAESVEVTAAACSANKQHRLFVCDGWVPISGWCQCSYCRQSPGDGVSRMCCGAASLPPHHRQRLHSTTASRAFSLLCCSCQEVGLATAVCVGGRPDILSPAADHRTTAGSCPHTPAGQSHTAPSPSC